MKNLFFQFLLLCSSFAIAQTKHQAHDFFVQYNGDQLTKKVSVAEVLNHSLFKEYNKENQEFTAQEMELVFKMNEKITANGVFADTLSFYQITIPVKNSSLLKEIMLRKRKVFKDSVAVETVKKVEDFGNFSMVLSDTISKKATIAWNQDYLVILELTDKYSYDNFANMEVLEEIDAETSEIDSTAIEVPNESTVIIEDETVETDVVTTEEDNADTNYFENNDSYDNYLVQKAAFERLQSQNQEEFVKLLFKDGFVPPHSDKVDGNADISSWISCDSFLKNAYKTYGISSVTGGMNNYFARANGLGNFIKGINVNAYFDPNNARIEELIEYDEASIKMVEKIMDRKINKKIYSYFPTEKPIGFFSYHIDTKELLTNFPSFTNQLFSGSSLFNEDITLLTDLISTIIDEKATATLLDGDFSFFVNDVVQKEIKIKTYDYNENFEEIEKEEIVTKSIPLFTAVFTSTHPTFVDKLMQLAVRKGMLKQENNRYYFTKTSEYGDLFILKDQDVVVIANDPDAFNGTSNGTFVKDVKSNLKRNSFIAKVDFEKVMSTYLQNKEKTIYDDKFLRLGQHFNSFEMNSSKKLKDNKYRFEMKLNSTQNDKNIILQFLDAIQEMK
ncbi:hypothetical protein [Flavobacterium adhaerens]|uniref:hypothetical protein n=1 Tax=Flavobacterium adhaerens TaxID=3149043 RepID=UPI0032B5F459